MRRVVEKYDQSTDTFYIQTIEDVEPLLDHLHEARSEDNYKKNAARWRKIGELPMLILDQWFREGFNALDPDNEKELIRRLSGPYKKFMSVDKI
jgi:hypothetical protein